MTSPVSKTKPAWASKTLWVNTVSLIAAMTGAYGMDLGLTPEVQASIVGGVMAIANIALRFMTDSALAPKKEVDDEVVE